MQDMFYLSMSNFLKHIFKTVVVVSIVLSCVSLAVTVTVNADEVDSQISDSPNRTKRSLSDRDETVVVANNGSRTHDYDTDTITRGWGVLTDVDFDGVPWWCRIVPFLPECKITPTPAPAPPTVTPSPAPPTVTPTPAPPTVTPTPTSSNITSPVSTTEVTSTSAVPPKTVPTTDWNWSWKSFLVGTLITGTLAIVITGTGITIWCICQNRVLLKPGAYTNLQC